MREFFLIFGIAILLLAGIWGVAKLSGGPGDQYWEPPSGIRGKTTVCYKQSEDVQADGLVCIYMCEDGEKARVDHLKTCLPKIEM
jgi:hypothetical protein